MTIITITTPTVLAYTVAYSTPYDLSDSNWYQKVGTSYTAGKATIQMKDTTRTYAQTDCPNGFTLIPGATATISKIFSMGAIVPTWAADNPATTINGTPQDQNPSIAGAVVGSNTDFNGTENVTLPNGRKQIRVVIKQQDFKFHAKKLLISTEQNIALCHRKFNM